MASATNGLSVVGHMPGNSNSADLSSNPPSFISMDASDLQAAPSNGLPAQQDAASELTATGGPKQYDELFPALPDASAGVGSGTFSDGRSAGAPWGDLSRSVHSTKTLPALPQSNKTEFFTIPFEERRHKDPPASNKFGGSVDNDMVSEREKKLVYDIGTQTNTSIELTTSKTDGGLTVVINGKAERVMEAKRQIMVNLVREAQTELTIPKEHYPHIIGSKRLRLTKLEQDTGTKIIMPRYDDESNRIIIKGLKDGINEAARRIQALSDELAKNDREVMEIEKKYHVFIMGPYNKTLESIRQQTGARIRVPALMATDDETITITGEKEAVAKAKALIEEIHTRHKTSMKDTSLQVPKAHHVFILGRGGQGLQEIFEKTGVWIEVPSQDSDSETIKLIGDPSQLGHALSMVFQKADYLKKELEVPTWMHKHLIGKKWENINRIRENFKETVVEFADDAIKIEGQRASVESVAALLQSDIDSIASKIKHVELRAPPSCHPHIIGKSGANVNRLKNELNVKIYVPLAEEENADIIYIEGESEHVDKACKELEELINKLCNKTVRELKCESRLHGQIIGPGGEKISLIRQKFNQVNIVVPPARQMMDVITIRGDREDVDECYNYLSSIVKDLQRTQYKLDVPLFKQFVRYLQGPRGRAILSRIQQETGVKRIQLPKEGQGSSVQVAIIGEREKAEKAKALLREEQRKNSDTIQKNMEIPSKLHGELLRQRKAALVQLLEKAGCAPGDVEVEFPAVGSNSDTCVLIGSNDAVERLSSCLQELIAERSLENYTEELCVSPQHHRFLKGRQGANIRMIREKTSARVVFPPEDAEDRETIQICGREEAVKAARKELEKMIADLENITEDTVTVPVKFHKHFVARRREVLNQLAEELGGAQANFPRMGSGSEEVILKGAKDCVAQLKERILKIVDELENQVTIDCIIPQVHHRIVLGAKGMNVRAITQDYNVKIKFPDRPVPPAASANAPDESNAEAPGPVPVERTADGTAVCDIIKITGVPEMCKAAKAALEAFVPITVEVPVDSKLLRFIIGQKGREVRELTDRFRVVIKVTQNPEGLDVVQVTGPPANVSECQVELEKRIRKFEEEENDRRLKSFTLLVDVPAKYHSKLVGRQGAVVSKIRENHQVQIQFPARPERLPQADVAAVDGAEEVSVSQDGCNTITVTGYEQNVYAARDEILKYVEEFESLVTRLIKLDHRIHSRIIGQRGRNVRKIMDDFKVDIKFPKQNAVDADLVEVTGSEDAVEDAIQYLKDQEDELMELVSDESAYHRPQQQTLTNIFQVSSNGSAGGTQQGFVVKGAPWSQSVPDSASQSDFPSFGDRSGQNGPGVVWGPHR